MIDNFISVINSQGFADLVDAVIDDIADFPEKEKELYRNLASYGWYTNDETPLALKEPVAHALNGRVDLLDQFMIDHLKRDWDSLTCRIIKNYPARAAILKDAFEFHKINKFNASIPLLFSQSDGIVTQLLGTNLFQKRNKKPAVVTSLIKCIKEGTIKTDYCLDIFYESLHVINDMNINSTDTNAAYAPNRHGVLHGLEDHLGYGTEKNSYKAFSLLAYLDSIFNS